MTARRLIRAGELMWTFGLASVMALPIALIMSAGGRHGSVVGPEARTPWG